MKVLFALIKRNTKLYFKDKGMFFSSLITPVILLILYSTFLKKVFEDSFRGALKAAGATVSDAVINGCVGGELTSSLLAVSCVTIAFCSNLLMIKDKVSGAKKDISAAPVRSGTVALSYYLSTIISTLIVCLFASGVCLGYLGFIGWYLSAADVAALLLDVLLLVLFGTALSSCINFFLSTDGQASAVGTLVSAGYGFICGAYMPISYFSKDLQKVLSFLPGTYGTSLLRNHALEGVFKEMSSQGFPESVISEIKKSVDCNLYFNDKLVTINQMYAIMAVSVVVLIIVYILLNRFAKKAK